MDCQQLLQKYLILANLLLKERISYLFGVLKNTEQQCF